MKKFEITREQIIELSIQNNIEIKLKKWFPDAFKTKFTGWAKDIHEMNEDWIAYYENDILKYGINANGDWFKSKSNANYNDDERNKEATEVEIKTALINEAKKRGYHNNCTNNKARYAYSMDYNHMYYNGVKVFDNGMWLETITK